ncbi:hypothetical protein MJO28_003589 [Puccinia striiformis f. sp. tritici]|uniref:Uncharacterized protein n=4 Tax=Puccinia striiformis TaxID=27350 RepID=A0A0L0UQN1_9BASI|nr:hypothetical protein MJO28_003589 [Puccinia striiformis f. sp. tritici]KAI9610879.1 hypothetical protein H4Q26_008723 [Puccinia striiformis f. sp. tritici PST-130]KNE89353.1 hypothetical protein PSTG_17188 [Puccinia striiformis f. sp. tritici PST-78]POW12346.1 hypothetical protein PSTT_04622 [Puccinia striiformis]KAI7964311.1 hypothetical protein MJO29_004738 [Puccinia striiformis f. sp. tritici]
MKRSNDAVLANVRNLPKPISVTLAPFPPDWMWFTWDDRGAIGETSVRSEQVGEAGRAGPATRRKLR